MRKLIALTALAACALTVGMAGVAGAQTRDVVQTTDGTITPAGLPAEGYQNVTMRVVTSVRDSEDAPVCASNAPPDGSCRTPPKASQAYVDFDRNIRFNQNAVAKCNPASVAGLTTPAARAACPTAIVGFGQAIARGGVVGATTQDGFVDGVITAFNGTGANQIILHVDLGGFGINLLGTLVNSPLNGFAKRLVVPVPNTGTALTRFDTTISRGRFVQARCGPGGFAFRGLFEYGHDRGVNPTPPPPELYPFSAIGQSTSPCIPRCGGRLATHVGTGGPDTILGTPGPDVIVGFGGNDEIRGFAGNDLICAGPGSDRVFAGFGHDRVFGEGGFDRLFGGPGADRLIGGAGPDRLFGGPGFDRLFGGPGFDRLFGGAGRDRLFGGPQLDRLFGGPGNDLLNGGAGRDRCFGGPGRDTYRRCAVRR